MFLLEAKVKSERYALLLTDCKWFVFIFPSGSGFVLLNLFSLVEIYCSVGLGLISEIHSVPWQGVELQGTPMVLLNINSFLM
jgi:hypothetical protein